MDVGKSLRRQKNCGMIADKVKNNCVFAGILPLRSKPGGDRNQTKRS